MSASTARTCASTISPGSGWTALTPTVLCAVIAVIARHAVHAAARERLQVCLHPGAATGVRAGDREHGARAGEPLLGAIIAQRGWAGRCAPGARSRGGKIE